MEGLDGVLDADTEALQALARNDAGAMRLCADRFGPLVWSIARRTLLSRTDAEDAAQEIFADLWRVAGKFDPELSSARAFVGMIARRRVVDLVRSQRRHTVGRRSLDGSTDSKPLASTMATSVHTDPSNKPALDEEAQAAMAELERLRPEQQKVIRLAVGESWTHERIADHLGMPLGTVKTHLRRGLIAIRDALGGRAGRGADRKEALP